MLGSGTVNDPYVIQDAADLQDVDLDLAAYYELEDDIDCSATRTWNAGAGFDPIGTVANAFTGYFNGLGYKIKNLYMNRNPDILAGDALALFGVIDSGAILKNIDLENIEYINDGNVTTSYTAGLACVVYGTLGTFCNISNCKVSGKITVTATTAPPFVPSRRVAGFIGSNTSYANISDCHTNITIKLHFTDATLTDGDCNVALFVINPDGKTANCSAIGSMDLVDVSANVDGVIGGFVCDCIDGTEIKQCYAKGTINRFGFSNAESIGGFAARIDNVAGQAAILNCYSRININTDGCQDYCGGFIGEREGGV